MLRSRYNYEDSVLECGIDEAGRGSFWGPMMAGAVIWPHEDSWTDAHREIAPKLKDSKKVTPKRRAVLDEQIRGLAIGWGIGVVTAREIDDNGVSWANRMAFVRAADAAIGCMAASRAAEFVRAAEAAVATTASAVAEAAVGCMAARAAEAAVPEVPEVPEVPRFLVDGILPMPPLDAYPTAEYLTLTDGDATYMSIAAASIIAKEAHDRWVKDYCEAYPELDEKYGLSSCKGYGTAKHREGISRHGLHDLHRRRFVHGAGRRGEKGLPVRLVDSECMVRIEGASQGT
jgi:ribonuclease HII